jgi:hypothetical protein
MSPPIVWMSKPYVPAVLSYCGLYRTSSLSDVHLTTLAGYAVITLSPQSQVVLHRTKGTAPLPRQQANALMLCLANCLLSLPYVVWTYRRRATEVGFWRF